MDTYLCASCLLFFKMCSLFEEINLPEKEFQELIEKAKDWALMHGVGMRSKHHFSVNSINFAPFTLFPTPLKREHFEEVISLQLSLGELMHKVANDREFLTSALEKTVEVDDFTRRLFNIYETVYMEGITQEISLELTRSDYLEDIISQRLKQVEFNTIASSFGGMSPTNVRLQSYILKEIGHYDKLKQLPENNALSGYCEGMLEAWRIFNVPDACILFVVEDVTYNICDQRFMEFELRELEPKIKVIRRTFKELHTEAKLGPNKELFVGKHRVGIVYYRSGYVPQQYSENGWQVRLLIERSDSIKCPNIQYHLSGSKKVQEVLTRPNVLERFLDENEAKKIRNLFTDIYPLNKDEPGGLEAEQLLMTNPEDFVLKPQREGGGNNIYGKDITDFINGKHEDPNWQASFIVMRMIRPITYKNCIVRPEGSILITDTISELGIFSVVIGSSSKIIYNKQTGHMLRTKPCDYNEGGVASGFGALDSPYLI
ncbi:glutathione synthetase-like isoform X3 [Rhodnius prolixus]|uniref:glutathione synthetase-like isoform X3 n=2 Tax=Rhodnius prolixus TaxID=13249 RepID=UPI003D1885A6